MFLQILAKCFYRAQEVSFFPEFLSFFVKFTFESATPSTTTKPPNSKVNFTKKIFKIHWPPPWNMKKS